MIVRIIVGIALAVFACGFIWFMAQVIYLGLIEFFKTHSKNDNVFKRDSVKQMLNENQDVEKEVNE